MQIFICFALFCLLSFDILGQEEQKPDSILLNEVFEFLLNEDYEKAVKQTNLCAARAIKNRKWEVLVGCQKILGAIGYNGDYSKEVIPFLEYNHSLIPDTFEIEKAYSAFYLGFIEEELGNTLSSLKHYLGTIQTFKNKGDLEFLYFVYGNLGSIYSQFGDYSRAQKYYNASKDRNLQIKDTVNFSIDIFNLARNYFFQEDYKISEKLFLQYLKLQPDASQEVFFHLSRLKAAQNQLDSARIWFTKANKFNNEAISDYEFNELYAEILCKEGNLDAAINFMVENETEIKALENRRSKGKYYYNLANLQTKKGLWKAAKLSFNNALLNFTNENVSIDSLSKLKQKNFYFHEIWIGDVLIGLSKIYQSEFRIHKDENIRLKSIECIDLALEALDYKRSFFEDIESSLFANKKSKALYEIAIKTYLEWYEESGKEAYLDEAFRIAQRHNAFVLRQQINERVKFDKFHIEDALKNQYFEQKRIVLESSLKLEENNSKQGLEQLRNQEMKLGSILEIINEKYPLFQQSKNDFGVVSAKKIQKELDKNKAVIKYFEGNEKLYSFVITKNKLSYFIHPDLEDINIKIEQLRSILSSFSHGVENIVAIEKKYLDLSQELSKMIINQEISILPKRIKKLVIIPTGTLTHIPFEPLVIRDKTSWNAPVNYLINEYAISYNYFCKALTSPKINNELYRVLTYGLEYDEYTLNASKKFSNDSVSTEIIEKFRSEEMSHLYFADDEANEVAKMFEGVSFTNENATKSSFLSNVSNYDIVHVSAHSFVDFQYPSNSTIIFSKKDSLTDNLLKIKDVDRLNLNGQLFTLSACNTFFGKKNEGEGLSSMARSFIQSGAGSVVGSFWSVPDEISKSFMVRFYSKLKQGLPKDEALRATKLDFMTDDNLSSPLYRSPAYWSAWVVYGDTQSISKPNNWMMYMGIILLFLGGLYLLKRKGINKIATQ